MSNSSQQAFSQGRLRRRARALVRQHQTHDSAVADLLRAHHPAFAGLSMDEVFAKPLTLGEAQLVLVREYGLSAKPHAALQPSVSVGKPRVIPELIEKPEYRRELAARRGLPPVGTKQVNPHGMEYTVIEHGFVLSQKGVSRANGSHLVPSIDEFMPMIAFTNMSPRLLDLYAEVDRCTCKDLFFFDTMPDKFPRQAVPGVHHVQTTQDSCCLTFHLDASRLHETILAHELGHLWIEFVEGCEDWRNLRDQSNMAKLIQFQHIQSFVLDLKVNDLIQSRGFDMTVINNHQAEAIQEMARHSAKGELPRTPRAAVGMANTIAAAILEQKRWPKSVLPEFITNLAMIGSAQSRLYRLAEQFVASVERHGYGNRAAICRVIDECAALSFQAVGEDFDPARDLIEIRPTEWMRDKHPGFLPGLPISTKLEVWTEAARHGLGTNVKWEMKVIEPGRVDVCLQDGFGHKTGAVMVSLNMPTGQLDVSRLLNLKTQPIGLPNPPQKQPWQKPVLPAAPMPHLQIPSCIQPHAEIQMAMPSLPMVPSVPWRSDHTHVHKSSLLTGRNYMAGVGLWLSRAGFEEQRSGEHPYGYVRNNPIIRNDPSGRNPLLGCAAGGIVGGIIGIGVGITNGTALCQGGCRAIGGCLVGGLVGLLAPVLIGAGPVGAGCISGILSNLGGSVVASVCNSLCNHQRCKAPKVNTCSVLTLIGSTGFGCLFGLLEGGVSGAELRAVKGVTSAINSAIGQLCQGVETI